MAGLDQWILRRKADRADDLKHRADAEQRAREAEGRAADAALDNPGLDGPDGIVDRLRREGRL